MSTTIHHDLGAEISAAVAQIILSTADSAASWNAPLRAALADTGFHRLGVPEHLGGSGGDVRDLAVVADLLAHGVARVSVADEAFVAGWLLATAGLPVPGGVTVAAPTPVAAEWSGDTLRLSGAITAPWGRHASAVVLLARVEGSTDRVVVVPVDGGWVEAENLAGEPRDSLALDGIEVPAGSQAPANGITAAVLLRRGALLRSIQLAGAARAVLDLTLRYVQEREQFGRPLSAFQAVQQQVAALAGEVNMMQMAAASAVLMTDAAEHDPALVAEAEIAVAAAKATTSLSARTVATIGHQVHGALGYSDEHPLGAVTARLWSWREEFGNEARWQEELGRIVARRGAWWSSISGTPVVTGGRA